MMTTKMIDYSSRYIFTSLDFHSVYLLTRKIVLWHVIISELSDTTFFEGL